MKTLDQYLYGVVQASNDQYPTEADGTADRSSSHLEESKSSNSETGSLIEEEKKSHQQLVEEVTMVPGAFVPIVMNPKFEFVPFESKVPNGGIQQS